MRRPARTRVSLALLCGLLVLQSAAVSTPPAAAVPAQQAQCFTQTGFCIDEPAFQQYFANRGGARILGFPVSRVFRLEGFNVQFFQRVVLQLQGGDVARLNLLDPGVLPVTRANQSIFPSPDPGLAAGAPRPDDPAYASAVVAYLSAVAPDSWNGLPVGFSALFNTTVPAEGVTPEIRTLLNLEIWGLPTSQPQFDPGNPGFAYQRFQRGIMHFRTDCGCTEGILVGDYLKGVLTGDGLPPDLAGEMQGSRYFLQYSSGSTGWVARPSQLSGTDMTGAFEPGSSIPMPTPTPVPAATPTPPVNPLASLSGRITPGQGGLQVQLLPALLSADANDDGSYRLADIPQGEYSAYAVNTRNGLSSDEYRINLEAGERELNMQLRNFDGSPAVYIGRVLDQNGNPINNALVWRLAGAGRTTSESSGTFRLVDAFGDRPDRASPRNVVVIATSGNRWGYSQVDFNTDPNRALDVRLTRTGRMPTPPRRVLDIRADNNTAQMQQTPRPFKAGDADYVTLFWPDEQNQVGLINVNPNVDGGERQSQDCFGNCFSYKGNIRVIRLPTNRDFTIGVQSGTTPNWAEAQVVAFPEN
jgi:hypothetical protein